MDAVALAMMEPSMPAQTSSYCTTSFKRRGRTTWPPPKMMEPVR